MNCEHKNFDANVNVMRFDDDKALASVRIICKDCGIPVKFLGLDDGVSLETATCSAQGTVAHLAFEMFQPVKKRAPDEDFYGSGVKPDRPTDAPPGSEKKKRADAAGQIAHAP